MIPIQRMIILALINYYIICKRQESVKKLSIIIVSYNVKYYLEQCLLSVQRAIEGIDAEVIVVDNHSHDGSVAYLERRFSHVNFVASNHNLGFARANNVGIRQSKGEYVLLLNPDTIVGEEVLKGCIEFMDSHPDAGGCGVKMIKANGEKANESRRGIPSPMTAFYKMSGLCARFPKSPKFGHYYMSDLSWDKPGQIEIISGAFCMIRRSALYKVGLLDEDYFMYGEDIDLSFRILKGGFKNWYLPFTILHYKGESTQKGSFRYIHVFYEAMHIFFRKHYSHLSFLLSIPIKLAIYAKALAALIGMTVNRIQKSLGFFRPNVEQFPDFIFIGEERAIAQCRRIARQKGLLGKFIIGNANTLPEGHLSEIDSLNPNKLYQAVYDTDAYAYKDILKIFESHPLKNVLLGTYNCKTRTIITAEEIYRHE